MIGANRDVRTFVATVRLGFPMPSMKSPGCAGALSATGRWQVSNVPYYFDFKTRREAVDTFEGAAPPATTSRALGGLRRGRAQASRSGCGR